MMINQLGGGMSTSPENTFSQFTFLNRRRRPKPRQNLHSFPKKNVIDLICVVATIVMKKNYDEIWEVMYV